MRQLAARLPPSEPTQSPVPVSPPPVAHVNRQTASPGTGHHSIPTQPPKTAHQPPYDGHHQPANPSEPPPPLQHTSTWNHNLQYILHWYSTNYYKKGV